ncbi:hypothetical protein PLANPX_1164 [Lacipirellula parvula]|uniref:Uncharacterized protein n=1 Tax=Lacipirellula parvula TaxID=2650471 RepID=A0A5K7X6V7_9BACT|nr:hypothetical protein PLANPX_1164 [Lacipirellula parvula]
MPRPQHWWAMRPGPERKRRKAEHARYFDKLDYFRHLCRKWGISLEGLPLDVTDDGTVCLCHTSVAMPTSAAVLEVIINAYVRTNPVRI